MAVVVVDDDDVVVVAVRCSLVMMMMLLFVVVDDRVRRGVVQRPHTSIDRSIKCFWHSEHLVRYMI